MEFNNFCLTRSYYLFYRASTYIFKIICKNQGRLGPISLQFAPEIDTDDTKTENFDVEKNMKRGVVDFAALVGNNDSAFQGEDLETKWKREQKEREERAKAAVDLAREKGLELPPMVIDDTTSGDSIDNNDVEVGKGMFDGW